MAIGHFFSVDTRGNAKKIYIVLWVVSQVFLIGCVLMYLLGTFSATVPLGP